MAYGMALSFTGGAIAGAEPWQDHVIWSKDFGNVPEQKDNPPVVADHEAQFRKLLRK